MGVTFLSRSGCRVVIGYDSLLVLLHMPGVQASTVRANCHGFVTRSLIFPFIFVVKPFPKNRAGSMGLCVQQRQFFNLNLALIDLNGAHVMHQLTRFDSNGIWIETDFGLVH
jgi:hypothetical protein